MSVVKAEHECETIGCDNPAEHVTSLGYICGTCARVFELEV